MICVYSHCCLLFVAAADIADVIIHIADAAVDKFVGWLLLFSVLLLLLLLLLLLSRGVAVCSS